MDVTGAGIEPAARALKVRCSTTELPSRSRDVPVYHRALENLQTQRRERQFGAELRGCVPHVERGVDLDDVERGEQA